jgi:hypothetical protein
MTLFFIILVYTCKGEEESRSDIIKRRCMKKKGDFLYQGDSILYEVKPYEVQAETFKGFIKEQFMRFGSYLYNNPFNDLNEKYVRTGGLDMAEFVVVKQFNYTEFFKYIDE